MPGAPVAIVVRDTGNTDAVLGQLSLELRKYVLRTRTAPKTFDEFISSSGVQAPPAPPGKKYVIDHGGVALTKS